ncbi:hypothetical protein A3841_18930 [Pontibacter flavimaris]|uniref:Uncharacterized protein n=1 Tax=Pontibacter flavimaris TaxID=1797110 RepID=A0A1Q5PDR3_9BACT|nr:hypothetical protein A3841_18930 [Pontibacter flavimaris]
MLLITVAIQTARNFRFSEVGWAYAHRTKKFSNRGLMNVSFFMRNKRLFSEVIRYNFLKHGLWLGGVLFGCRKLQQ